MTDETFTGHVVLSVSIQNLVQQRAAVAARIKQAIEILDEARDIASAAHIGFPRFMLQVTRRGSEYLMSFKERERYKPLQPDDETTEQQVMSRVLREIDSTAWQHLLNESGLRSFMSADIRKKWDEQIYEGEIPELTMDNVEATFATLYATRSEMFEQGVLQVFKNLSWNYKTNEPFRFGDRIVMSWMLSYGSVSHEKANRLDDLMRVLCKMDGKPEPDHRNAMYVQMSDFCRASSAYPKKGENEYLSWKLFKNGNVHVKFLRPDLVDKLNEIVARHYPGALPYDRNAA